MDRLGILLTDAKLARMEMMNRGIVLKKHTSTKKIQPVAFLLASSPEVALRFIQIYEECI